MRTLACLMTVPICFGQNVSTRTIKSTCDQVWFTATQVFLSKHLTPTVSDRTGGFMKLRWMAGDEAYRNAKDDVAKLTTFRPRWTNPVERFRIAEVVFTISPASGGCIAGLPFSYLGYTPVYGWIELPSNGAFENRFLTVVDNGTDPGTAPVGSPADPGPSEHSEAPKSKAASALSENQGSIIIRITSTPTNAEVDIDGEYWGSTPTADLTRLPPGQHTIFVMKVNFEPWERKITIAPGDNRTINAELQPRDASKPRISGN